jgi:predicted metalloprotease with PDZ domain
LPHSGDRGLDFTPTWGRTYWGGALFCLLADVEIRRRTGNGKGLVDGLRAVLRAGGNISADWKLERILRICDEATGVKVTQELYAKMRAEPYPVDLEQLWKQLGVVRRGDTVLLRNDAPLAGTRRAIVPENNDARQE